MKLDFEGSFHLTKQSSATPSGGEPDWKEDPLVIIKCGRGTERR